MHIQLTTKQMKMNKKNKQNHKRCTESLLTQFGATSPTLGATKPGRKSTSAVRIEKLSANHVCIDDLGPTPTRFQPRNS
jgi:hypothetical protein